MSSKYNRRVFSVYLFFILLFSVLALKIFYLQVFKSSFFQSLADNQHYRLFRLEGKRGVISDRRGRVLAQGLNRHSIFADPRLIKNSEHAAEILSLNLDLSKEGLIPKLNKKKRFVWIKRKASLDEKERIKTFNLKGIGFVREERRFYPQAELTSSFTGIVDIDNKGLEGIELYYDDYLRGKDGWTRVMQDSASREIVLSSQIIIPRKGTDLILSIDAQVQYWVKYYLKETVDNFKAKSAAAVVMDASNGRIIALANYPDFNPNDSAGRSSKNIKNRAVCDIFEPGSVFKVVTLLAAAAENKFSDEDKIFCENGRFKVPGTVLHDWKPYGELSFKEVFMKSSNIGVAKVVQSLGADVFYRAMKRLGFGRLSGIDLPGEAKGIVKPLSEWSNTSEYIMPMGQEVGVNLIQLVLPFAVVANGGYLVKPCLVKDMCSQGFCKAKPIQRKRVFSSSAAARAKNILIEVVKNGTGKRADIKGVNVGGKTGTAQKYDPKIKRYSPDKYRATFVGFISDINPPIVIGVTVDEPKKSHFGGVVAAPVFKEIARKIIKGNYQEQQ